LETVDCCEFVFEEGGFLMKELTANDVMNREVITVRDDMTVQEVATFLIEQEISGAPVVDDSDEMVGVVSLTDIAESTMQSPDVGADQSNPGFYVRGWEDDVDWSEVQQLHIENAALPVRDIMTPTVYTVSDDTPVSKIAKTMIAGRIHRLFVTRNGEVVGIITSLDLLKILAD
jgi:CBS domain-containing protein